MLAVARGRITAIGCLMGAYAKTGWQDLYTAQGMSDTLFPQIAPFYGEIRTTI